MRSVKGAGGIGRRLGDVRRLWAASAAFAEGRGAKPLARRVRFVAGGMRARSSAGRLLAASDASAAGRLVRARPQLLGLFTAPYLCARWDPAMRVDRLLRHIEALETVPPLGFLISEGMEIIDLREIGEDYRLILDKSEWFHREGLLVLNLFEGNVRLFSLAFALERGDEGLIAMIGGIQGRRLPAILERYRELTKLAHGMRPRDLLLELFRMFCREIGCAAMLAVSDGCRHHRSPFFGKETDRELPLDYDAIWIERNGVRRDDCFFEIPLARQSRDDSDIPARKRSMYRRRYEMLDAFEGRMSGCLAHSSPQLRPEAF